MVGLLQLLYQHTVWSRPAIATPALIFGFLQLCLQ